ncbi:hypothetical protein Droror1_Dr00009593 [Drosera rotundifolia]
MKTAPGHRNPSLTMTGSRLKRPIASDDMFQTRGKISSIYYRSSQLGIDQFPLVESCKMYQNMDEPCFYSFATICVYQCKGIPFSEGRWFTPGTNPYRLSPTEIYLIDTKLAQAIAQKYGFSII